MLVGMALTEADRPHRGVRGHFTIRDQVRSQIRAWS